MMIDWRGTAVPLLVCRAYTNEVDPSPFFGSCDSVLVSLHGPFGAL